MLPAMAIAQDARDLDNAPGDVRIFTGEVTTVPVVYTYTIPPQTALVIEVSPTGDSALDPTVTVVDLATGEVLAEDDDGGGGVAARARIYSENGQRVEITVTAFGFLTDAESYGGFQLRLREVAVAENTVRSVDFGETLSGSIEGPEPRIFTIDGRQGQLLEVAMLAGADGLDPVLELRAGDGIDGELLASDDDGGNELDAVIRYLLPETGRYTIRASSTGETFGDFELRIGDGRLADPQPAEQVIELGETLTGRLGTGDGGVQGGDPDEVLYRFSEEAISAIISGSGEVTINMTGPLFANEDFPSGVDPAIALGFETPLGFAEVLADDDSGGALNARIATDLAPLAEDRAWLERLRIRARSVAKGGEYAIQLVPGLQSLADVPEDAAQDAIADEAGSDDVIEELQPAPPRRAQPDSMDD